MKRSGILRIKVEVKGDDSDSADDKTLKPEVKKDDDSKTLKLEGAIELHRLVLEDFDELKRRADDIDEAIVNATCSVDGGEFAYKEVSQVPLSFFPGDTADSRLLVQSLGLSAPAPEQWRRSKQSCKIKR